MASEPAALAAALAEEQRKRQDAEQDAALARAEVARWRTEAARSVQLRRCGGEAQAMGALYQQQRVPISA